MLKASPKICILLATYNGERYIREQLASISKQTHQHWHVIVSDDNSTDDTLEIVREYQHTWGADKLSIINGPQSGFCTNFLSLAINTTIKADLYAFCDQDDVWYPQKLAHVIKQLDWSQYEAMPTLYCGRTEVVDNQLKPMGLSPLLNSSELSFRNALVQSIAGGNTMVFNHATKTLLTAAGQTTAISHDWWLYQLVTGANGNVFYDPAPLIQYRQHPNSLVGANISWHSQFKRITRGFKNQFKEWNDVNTNALNQAQAVLSEENKKVLAQFNAIRHSKSLITRIKLMRASGLYRQSPIGTVKLWLATILNKI